MKINKIKSITILVILLVMLCTITSIHGFEPVNNKRDQKRTGIILINEGFENEFPPAGWANSNPSGFEDGWNQDMPFGDPKPHNGSHHAYSWAINDNLTTNTVTFYQETELSFWYRAEIASHPMSLEILIDGVSVWSNIDFNHTTYQKEIIDLSGFTGNHSITFLGLTSDFLVNY